MTKFTPTDIEARFEEAAQTLRRLPHTGYYPSMKTSSWPEIVQSVHTAYGYDAARMPRITPTPQAITRMEETFEWLRWLEPDDARIVWLRGEGVRWKPICYRVGLSRSQAWRHWVAAMILIANRLNAGAPKRQSRATAKKPKALAKAAAAETQILI